VVSNASTTSPAAMASGDVDAASHSPLDLLIRFHSCLVLDAGFNHQMQSNPGMPMSEDEYGHHQLSSTEHGHVHTCGHEARSRHLENMHPIEYAAEAPQRRLGGTPGPWPTNE
jgi:hypothetical protein